MNEAVEAAKRKTKMRALVVDDSAFVREYVVRLLERMEVVCIEAENGKEALDVLWTERGFDLILLDLNMPVMNGLECLKALRRDRLCPSAKVMMVTTEADFVFIEQALAYGADEFLMKPFKLEGLREKMRILGLMVAA